MLGSVSAKSMLSFGVSALLASCGIFVAFTVSVLGLVISAVGLAVPVLAYLPFRTRAAPHIEIEIGETGELKVTQSCPKCRRVMLDEDAEACPLCGAKVEQTSTEPEAEAEVEDEVPIPNTT